MALHLDDGGAWRYRLGPIVAPAGGGAHQPLVTDAVLAAAGAQARAAFWGEVASDGADIRMTLDAAGDVPAPIDLVGFDFVGQELSLFGRADLTTGADLYLWAGNAAALAPAATDANGRNAVWSQTAGVYMGDLVDRAGVGPTLTTVDSPPSPSAEFLGPAFQGSQPPQGYWETEYTPTAGSADRMTEFWIKSSTTSGQQAVFDYGAEYGGGRYSFFVDDSRFRLEAHGGGTTSSVVIADGTWHHVAVVTKTGNIQGTKVYLDGQLAETLTRSRSLNTSTGGVLRVGASYQRDRLLGDAINYIRFWSDTAVPTNHEAWLATQYALECDPAGVLDAGAAVHRLPGAGGAVTLTAVTATLLAPVVRPGDLGRVGRLTAGVAKLAAPTAEAGAPGRGVALAAAPATLPVLVVTVATPRRHRSLASAVARLPAPGAGAARLGGGGAAPVVATVVVV